MGALWTGIHPIWVPYGPGPILAINTYIEGGVLLPTACPGTTGVTSPTTRGYSPCQAKRLKAPQHSEDWRRPALGQPKDVTPLIYCMDYLPAHPSMYRFEPVTPQLSIKIGPNLSSLIPSRRGYVSWFFPGS